MKMYALFLVALLVPIVSGSNQTLQTSERMGKVPWSFIPAQRHEHNADPTARVYNNRLYVYTSWDHILACGPRWSQPRKKEGSQKFCMPGYRLYSTSDANLRNSWTAHGPILIEENVPWVYRGDNGWKGAARMWAPDVVKGNDGRYYLFFPAPATRSNMRIGVAVSNSPTGPFKARPQPIAGTAGIDPAVVRLRYGKWILFSSSGSIFWQEIDANFMRATPRKTVQGLFPGGYKEAPFAEMRYGNLILHYAFSARGGYRIKQAVAKDRNNPSAGFIDRGNAIDPFDGQTNHGSVVTFKGKSWAFYHRHFPDSPNWRSRRVVFSPIVFRRDGTHNTISPKF